MADVRSMLRAEREARRITHPHASYTSTGGLLCNLCDTAIKSEKAWGAHLHSTQHNLRLSRDRDAAQLREGQNANKKRKAVEFEEPDETERKKARPEIDQDIVSPDANQLETTHDDGDAVEDDTVIVTEAESGDIGDAAVLAHLEALDREFKEARRQEIASAATISAPAMTAEESAAQQDLDAAAKRSQRDIDAEEAKEDATRALEEEFDEMQTLQERVQKLKERREAVRVTQQQGSIETEPEASEPELDSGKDPDVVEDDDSDEEDEDEWAFGAR